MRILIVEDDAECRSAFTEVLSETGFEVIAVGGGADAIAALATLPIPDAILLDLVMPDVDGAEVRRRQLADPRWAKIPVVLISGARDLELHAAALNVRHWLRKPIGFEALVGRVKEAVGAGTFGSGQRRSARERFHGDLDVTVAGRNRWARGENVSQHGVCFHCQFKVALGDALQLSFPASGPACHFAVVRYAALEEDHFTVGVEFFEPISRDELQQILAAR